MVTGISDVVIAGGGLAGLCSAVALSERRVSVTIVSEPSRGEASRAAAGRLAPSVERASGPAHDFAIAARDRYPSYLAWLQDRTGISVPLNREGILQVALSRKGVKGLGRQVSPTASWLDAAEVASLEPQLSHALGAVYNPLDGAVDNVALMDALDAHARKTSTIGRIDDRVQDVESHSGGVEITTRKGTKLSAKFFVVAAGAWSGQIEGARFAKFVSPAKGQLVSYPYPRLRHAVYGPRGYVVPRGDSLIGGSTTEDTGFESGTSKEGIAKIRSAAEEICPALSAAEVVSAWAGLRPVTPDMLPLLGPDPDQPEILYACGHSRNGVLMAPLTGDIIADLVTASPLRH